MSDFVILKWRLLENKAKFEKRFLFFKSQIGILTYFLKDFTKKVLKIYNSNK